MTARRLSAHIGYLFKELPLARRPAAARRAGFDAIEHPDPFEIPAVRMAEILAGEGLAYAQIAAGAGDASKGEKGIAAIPGRQWEFRQSFRRSLDYAEAVGIPFVHPMAGTPPADAEAGAALATYTANLRYAVEACEKTPCSVLIEAISRAVVPGYYLGTLSEAVAAVEAADAPGVRFLVDTFHAASNGEDAARFVRQYGSRVGHIHIADYPGRHEPGTGTIEFAPLLDALAGQRYAGAVGFEYIPAGDTEAGLGWMSAWRSN